MHFPPRWSRQLSSTTDRPSQHCNRRCIPTRATCLARLAIIACMAMVWLAAPSVAAAQQCDPQAITCDSNQAPSTWVAPSQTAVYGAYLTVSIGYCDPDSPLDPTTERIWVNGTEMHTSFSYSPVNQTTCYEEESSVGRIRLQMGTNTVQSQICDSPRVPSYCANGWGTYTAYQTIPQVRYSGQSSPLNPSSTMTSSYWVKNVGNYTGPVSLSVVPQGGSLTGCVLLPPYSAPGSTSPLAPGDSVNVTVQCSTVAAVGLVACNSWRTAMTMS